MFIEKGEDNMEKETYTLTNSQALLLGKAIIILLEVVLAILLIMSVRSAKELRLLEENIKSFPISDERLPVKESTKRYIESLPLPEETEYAVQELAFEEIVFQEDSEDEKVLSYTSDDIYVLAQIMYAEEGLFFREYSTNPEMVERVHKLAGSVVLHRVENHYLGSTTILEVLYKPGQYDVLTINRVEEGQDIPEIVYQWAEDLLRDGPLGPRGLIFQSEFKQGEIYEEIGNQKFGIDPRYQD